ncbi:MAG TPA: Rad52/Rad22 family DNA repair protein [Fimbriiglobus sp.]|nr:Rad52/Rad22 family DNA repair protein [Fimbriiglobus sp.]
MVAKANRTGHESPTGVNAITAALARPFDHDEVKFKPQAVKNNRALALAYVDARVIQDRLDEVLGVEGWQDEYQLLPDGSVVCKLTLKLGDQWITKMDVGSPSEQPDSGDRLKAAFSDALKRAAVKFGVGRYLYRLPAQWADYDPVKKQFARPPLLPSSGERRAVSGEPEEQGSAHRSKLKAQSSMPADGEELHRRLREYDAKLAARKLCTVGALLSHVAQAGAEAGYGVDMTTWSGPAIPFAVNAVKEFEACLRKPKTAAA